MTEASSSSSPLLRLRVTAAAERALRRGHPWVFADSIVQQNRTGETGELAVIYDRQNSFLAIGLYDSDSPIRFRLLTTRGEELGPAWWRVRLSNSIKRRTAWLDESTTGYRCIHGESDGWPALVLDRYDRTCVLKLYSGAWFPRLKEIAELIHGQLKPERIVLRLSRNLQSAVEKLALSDGQILAGTPLDGPVTFLESGLKFQSDVLRGQKTGFFLDQRENRRAVEELASGRNVLNAFSFSGGFSVYAARGGALSATDLDISHHALTAARVNFELNRSNRAVAACRYETIQADAFEWLGMKGNPTYHLIVLDPPSLAKRESERAGALTAYYRLATSALKQLSRQGILVACSCSAHVTAEEFFEAVRNAARHSKREWEELRTSGQPPDHPATFPEAKYLKGIFLRVGVGS